MFGGFIFLFALITNNLVVNGWDMMNVAIGLEWVHIVTFTLVILAGSCCGSPFIFIYLCATFEALLTLLVIACITCCSAGTIDSILRF